MDATIARLAAQLSPDQKSAIQHDQRRAPKNRKPLTPLDLTLLRRSFPADLVTDQNLMALLSSNTIAPHVRQFWHQSFAPATRGRSRLLGLFPNGISRARDMQHVEERIAFLAMKMHTTGLGPYDIETHQLKGFAWSAERLFKDGDALFDLWNNEVDLHTKFLACARIVITIYEDLESYYENNGLKNFSWELIEHPVSKSIARPELRQAWQTNFKIPATGKPGKPLPTPSIDNTNEPGVGYVHNSASTWEAFEQHTIIVQYKNNSASHLEHNEEFDWAELAKCVPGRTANDCIQFFNSSKGLFDKEGEPDVPYSDTSPAVSRTKHYKEPLQARVEELEKELEAMKLRAAERAEREAELEDEIKQLKADTAAEPVHKKAKKD